MKRSAPLASLLLITATAALAADVKETVSVTIAGGPNAGRHEASTDKGGCSAGLTGPGSWGNQLSNPKEKDGKKLNSVQLEIPNAKQPNEFQLTVAFGPLMNRTATYTVDTRPKGKKAGSGSVTIDDRGSTATVKFAATTADGVKLDGTIDCKSVLRSGK